MGGGEEGEAPGAVGEVGMLFREGGVLVVLVLGVLLWHYFRGLALLSSFPGKRLVLEWIR